MPKKNDLCYCCSQIEFKICCEPFLKGKQIPNTPELLMRSRYTAFCLTDMVYVQKTMQGKALQNFNLRESLSHTKKCKWTSLKIISTSVDGDVGAVEFIADFSMFGKAHCLHEKSEFHFNNGRWYYVTGIILQ